MSSGHIAQAESEVEQYDTECPHCGSDDVWRNTTYDVSELSLVSPWCEACGHGWMESV